MARLLASWIVAAALIAPYAIAQTPPEIQNDTKRTGFAQGTPDPVIVPFCVGTVFNATLVSALDAQRSKAGDVVTAEISETVSYERSVVFPKGTKIVGHLVRTTSAGRHGKGSALFVQFNKAILRNGQEVMMNAGIQALVAGPTASVPADTEAFVDQDLSARNQDYISPRSEVADASNDATVVATSHDIPRKADLRSTETLPAATQGGLTKNGLLTPNSQGAFGSSDLKVYTPLSEGSDGTVLLSAQKNVRLEAGAKLLIVIQPPPEMDPSLE